MMIYFFVFSVSELVTLAEEDELKEVTIDDFVENSKSAFTILLENDKNLEVGFST